MKTPSNDTLRIACAVLFGIAFLICLGRFVIRWRKVGKFQADDYLQMLSLACLVVFTGLIEDYLPDVEKLQTDRQSATIDRITKVQRYNAIVTVIGKLILLSVQGTFLALYWIVFSVSKRFRVWWFVVASWCVLAFLISFFAGLFYCGNIHDIDSPIECRARFGTDYTKTIIILVGTVNVLAELSVILLPVMMLRTLEMSWSQKLGLGFVFTLGFCTVAFDLTRCTYTSLPQWRKNININFLWSELQPPIAITAAALPTYYSLLQIGKPKTNKYYDEFDRTNQSAMSKSGKGNKSEGSRLGASANRESGGAGLKRDELELKLIDRQERAFAV